MAASGYFSGMSQLRSIAATCLLVGALSVACTTPSPPATSASPTREPATATSPTASSSPTPTTMSPPPQPEAMRGPGVEGATAAGAYFVDLVAYLFETGDESPWRVLVADDCRTCAAMLEDARATTPGESSGALRVLQSSGVELTPGQSYSATLIVEQQPPAEAAETATAAPTFRFYFALSYADGWKVDALDIAPADG